MDNKQTFIIKTRTLIEFEDIHIITGPGSADAAVAAVSRPDYRMCFPPKQRTTQREEFEILSVETTESVETQPAPVE